MSDCADCGADANYFCEWCEIPLCEKCFPLHCECVLKESENDAKKREAQLGARAYGPDAE